VRSPAADPATLGAAETGSGVEEQERGRMRYEFLLPGRVSGAVTSEFPELTPAADPAGGTVMSGPVQDNAALHGLLDRFQAFGLTVLALRQLPD
jgi:hypothetical protein